MGKLWTANAWNDSTRNRYDVEFVGSYIIRQHVARFNTDRDCATIPTRYTWFVIESINRIYSGLYVAITRHGILGLELQSIVWNITITHRHYRIQVKEYLLRKQQHGWFNSRRF